jgi:DNA-binding transcriptional MerR regulator
MPTQFEPRNSTNPEERQQILYLLGDAVERLVRLRLILNRQEVFIEAEHRKVEYAGVIQPIFVQLQDQAERLIINSARISSFLHGEMLDETQRTALAGIIQTVISVTLMLHELLILLPREAPETQVFLMLENCFKDEWRETSVIMTNALSSYEYRIEDVLEKLEDIGQQELKHWKRLLKGFTRSGSVLAQAFIDRDNPLAWAVLAHEYGHALDEMYGVSKQIVHGDCAGEESADDDPKVKWASEIYADFVAARALGPASMMPMLLLEMTRPLAKARDEASTHPPTVVRLSLLRRYLKDQGVSTADFEVAFQLYESDYETKLAALEQEEQEKKYKLKEVVEQFLESCFPMITSRVNSLKLRPFGGDELSHAKKLQKKLASDLPISSLRQVPDGAILERLNWLVQSKATPEQVYEVLSDFNEIQASSSEIVTAGWLHKLSSFEECLKRTFPDKSSSSTVDLETYGQYLLRIDELLLKSLELAVVSTGNPGVT